MATLDQISLYYRDHGSDKEYHVQLEEISPDICTVNFQYGRRGSSLTSGTKTPATVSRAKAQAVYDKLVREKTAKGYTPGESGVRYTNTPAAERVTGLRPQLLNPMPAEDLQRALISSDFWMQEKLDGRRVQIRLQDGRVIGSNKLGLEIALPEPVAQAVINLPYERLDLDGELIGSVYHVFDLTARDTALYGDRPYEDRFAALQFVMRAADASALQLVKNAITTHDKLELYRALDQAHAEGVVFKDPTAPYVVGRPSSGGPQLKWKFTATGSFLVTRVNPKMSVGLGLLTSGGVMVPTGNVTIPQGHCMPTVGDIVEVRYLYAMPDSQALFQPVFLCRRDDIRREECLLSQLKYRGGEETDDPSA